MQLSLSDLLSLVSIVAVMLLCIVLYHTVFIAVNLRRLTRRINDLYEDVEEMIIKPLSVADSIMEWLRDYFKGKADHHGKNHAKKKVEVVVGK